MSIQHKILDSHPNLSFLTGKIPRLHGEWHVRVGLWFYYNVSSDLGSRRKGMMPMKVTPLRSVQGFSYGSPVTTTFLKLSPM